MVALETNYIVCVILQHFESFHAFGLVCVQGLGAQSHLTFSSFLERSAAAGNSPKFYHQMTFTKQRIGIFALAIDSRDICLSFV